MGGGRIHFRSFGSYQLTIQSSIKYVDLQRSAVVKSLNADLFCPSECAWTSADLESFLVLSLAQKTTACLRLQ